MGLSYTIAPGTCNGRSVTGCATKLWVPFRQSQPLNPPFALRRPRLLGGRLEAHRQRPDRGPGAGCRDAERPSTRSGQALRDAAWEEGRSSGRPGLKRPRGMPSGGPATVSSVRVQQPRENFPTNVTHTLGHPGFNREAILIHWETASVLSIAQAPVENWAIRIDLLETRGVNSVLISN